MKIIAAFPYIKLVLLASLFFAGISLSEYSNAQISNQPLSSTTSPHIAILPMSMMILPGTASYLASSIEEAHSKGAKLLIIELNTPGGILDTAQSMIQTLFQAPIPVVVYVTPQGSIAASAGVFITMAAHIAAMSPGTSIGAAHPVQGDGKDIEGDMRLKAENMTIAMVKSVAEQRGHNVAWAEKSVKESSSLTAPEALKEKVIDIVAEDITDLLRQINGRKIKIGNQEVTLEDYSKLPQFTYEMRFQDKFMNVLANPNVAALLWLAATTGISIELYNPGLILPGVVGVIALVFALIVSQIIPISQGALALVIVGAVMIGLELFTGSIVIGLGGIVSLIFGVVYLVDSSRAPGLSVAANFIVPIALVLGGFLLFVAKSAYDVLRGKKSRSSTNTGKEGMLMKQGEAASQITTKSGKVFIDGEYWNAVSSEGDIILGDTVIVAKVLPGLLLEVKKV